MVTTASRVPTPAYRAFASAGTPKRGLDASNVAVPPRPFTHNLIRVNARKRDRDAARRRSVLNWQQCERRRRREKKHGRRS
jgi:hypothetical protein